jgi:uncharacterized membrane protein
MSIKILLIILVAIAIILVTGLIFLRSIFPPALSQKATEKDFVKNQDNIMIVTDYLINSKYNELSIHHTGDGKTMFANLDGNIIIEDSQVVEATAALFKNGYKKITKHYNTIRFLRSSPTMDFGSGVIYSIDGHTPDEQSTKLEPMPLSNWYYYEYNDNEFRKQAPTIPVQ